MNLKQSSDLFFRSWVAKSLVSPRKKADSTSMMAASKFTVSLYAVDINLKSCGGSCAWFYRSMVDLCELCEM